MLEEPVEKRRLTPTQQLARAVMNFCSLRGYAASELSRQAAPCARQMIITQGCKLEANGLNLDGSWLELCSLKNINWHASVGGFRNWHALEYKGPLKKWCSLNLLQFPTGNMEMTILADLQFPGR